MYLVVKRNGHTINEFRTAEGPVHIGRRSDNQIPLPDRAISKKHATIFNADDGKWMVEDLDSANKTYLNDEAIHKAEIKTGDCLRIADFTIEIDLEAEQTADKAADSEDTLVATSHGPQIIIRKLGAEQAPTIRFPAERAVEFLQATDAICKTSNLDELLLTLLDIVSKQFSSYHTWCAVRNQPDGPMTCHAGRQRDGQSVEISDIKLSEKITEAVEKQEFLLFIFSRAPGQKKGEGTRSVLIAPIMSLTGCFGVLYADNAMGDEHYSLSDLDYLMVIAMHTTARLQNF